MEKKNVLNESFKPLAFCPRTVKDDWSDSALIYHNALFPLSETRQRYKGYVFLD